MNKGLKKSIQEGKQNLQSESSFNDYSSSDGCEFNPEVQNKNSKNSKSNEIVSETLSLLPEKAAPSYYLEQLEKLNSDIDSTFSQIEEQISQKDFIESILLKSYSLPENIISKTEEVQSSLDRLLETEYLVDEKNNSKNIFFTPKDPENEKDLVKNSEENQKILLRTLNRELDDLDNRVDIIWKKLIKNNAASANVYDRIATLHRRVDLVQRLQKNDWHINLPRIDEGPLKEQLPAVVEMNNRLLRICGLLRTPAEMLPRLLPLVNRLSSLAPVHERAAEVRESLMLAEQMQSRAMLDINRMNDLLDNLKLSLEETKSAIEDNLKAFEEELEERNMDSSSSSSDSDSDS